MLQEQIANEMRYIPDSKLSELYYLIHYFRLGLIYEKKLSAPINKHPIGLAKDTLDTFSVPDSFFDQLPDAILNTEEEDLLAWDAEGWEEFYASR